MVNIVLFLIAIAVLALLVYLAGFHLGKGELRHERRRLRSWVQDNWPDEHQAYSKGVTDGYQQGLNHSPTLLDDDR